MSQWGGRRGEITQGVSARKRMNAHHGVVLEFLGALGRDLEFDNFKSYFL